MLSCSTPSFGGKWRIAFFAALMIGVSGCSRFTDWELDRKITELQRLVDRSLHPGDSREAIVEFYNTQGWGYTFDRFRMRYQSSYPEALTPRSYSNATVGIFIYVNEDGSFKRGEVTKHLPY